MPETFNRYIFDEALKQLERGRSVIPLIGKVPAIDWAKYHKERPTLEDLRNWFGDANFGHFNYGIVTGVISDSVVVDCDSRKAAEWFWQNIAQTPEIVKTGREEEGFHFYFKAGGQEGKNAANLWGRKIDLKWTGGQVVGPGSVHPDSGKQYVRIDTRTVDLDEVPVFNPAWLEGSRKPQDHLPDVGKMIGKVFNCKPDCKPNHIADVGKKVRNALAYAMKIESIEGNRGSAALVHFCHVLREGGYSEAQTLLEAQRWNRSGKAQPPWSDDQLLRAVTNAFKRSSVQQ